jgi:glycosyltransferase involved in cell wall biosynthesis
MFRGVAAPDLRVLIDPEHQRAPGQGKQAMRILIDLQGAQSSSRHRGIGRYSDALARAIIRNRGDHEIFILLNGLFDHAVEQIRREYSSLLPANHITVFSAPFPVGALVSENAWRREAAELLREAMIDDIAPDFLLITSLFEGAIDDSITSIGRLPTRTKVAVVLHDLIPLIDPEPYLFDLPVFNWYYSKIDAIRRADLLLANSESTRYEGIDMLGFPAGRVVAIHAAADERFTAAKISPEEGKALLARLHLRPDFIMHVGAVEPRKNFEGLIRAFALLPEPLRRKHQLVLVGDASPDSQAALRRVASAAGLKPDALALPGHVSDRELVALYALCTLFVFPSFHEGFGLPVLEAMCCGAAVIGSNTTGIPEVIGRQDALFDPHSDQDIANLMRRALTDAPFLQSLKEHARRQAQRFSWDRSAQLALRAIQGIESPRRQASVVPDSSLLLDRIAAIKAGVPPTRSDSLSVLASIAENESAARRLEMGAAAEETLRAAVEAGLHFSVTGHLNGSYSLAAVNRRLALMLEAVRPGTVRAGQVEGEPVHDLSGVPAAERAALAALAARQRGREGLEVEIVQHWPVWVPSHVTDLRLAVVAWEESLVPRDMVRVLNEKFDGILVPTRFVAKALIDSGVRLPVRVIGHAPALDALVRVGERRAAAPRSGRPGAGDPFTFLHVSSCFPRKGVDALLAAYGKAFRRCDPVRLVVKGFPNPHNDVPEQIASLRRRDPEAPAIVMINRDIPAEEMAALYAAADAVVLPTRGEGFNIPAAEALAAGVPLIVTGYSGHTDFAGRNVARHVEFRFAQSKSHVGAPGSVWVDPDVDDLAAAMREVFDAAGDPAAWRDIAARAARGRRVAKTLGDGAAWAARIRGIAVDLLLRGPRTKPAKIAWVTTWNIRCGIATYSRYLLDAYPDAARDVTVLCDEQTPSETMTAAGLPQARVAWRAGDPTTVISLAQGIAATGAGVVVIQHQPGLFGPRPLLLLLHDERLAGRETIVVLHNLQELVGSEDWDGLAEALRRVSRVLVHNVHDLNLLGSCGLVENVVLFPHGALRPAIERRPARDLPASAAPLIGAYGFVLPHKGFDVLIEALAEIRAGWPEARLRMATAEYPTEESSEEIDRCRELAASLGLEEAVEWHTDFLPDEDSLALLNRCDLLVLPYRDTLEAASGAARVAMASRVPVLVTPARIFDEMGEAVIRAQGMGREALAAAIARCLHDPDLRRRTADAADRWLAAHDWARMSERLHGMIHGLVANSDAFARLRQIRHGDSPGRDEGEGRSGCGAPAEPLHRGPAAFEHHLAWS